MSEKVKGVYWNNRDKKWAANIMVDGKQKYLGLFKTYDEAVSARKEAESKYGYVPLARSPKLKHKNDLTQDVLKELLHYNPETGDFTWKVRPTYNVKIGSIAGSLDNNGYIEIQINKKRYKAHRLAFLYMNGKFPEVGLVTDHINHITNDNRWNNLRIVTAKDNLRNSSMSENNTSGCTGVYLNGKQGKWHSRINVNGKQKYLGYFKNKEDAIAARKQAEIKYNYHENHGKQNNQLITQED